jgi:hypothetical protein
MWLRESRDIRDLRPWFRATRRLPEFSFTDAISRIERFAHLSPDEPDPHFYLYTLYFLLGFLQKKDVEDKVVQEMDKTRKLTAAYRYRNYGYEWLGNTTVGCPVVHFTELGQWDAASHDYPPDGARLLRRMSGIIERIEGPEKGWIKLGTKLRAFFPPRKDFSNASDQGREVNFYLGFTYDGFRAYGVKHVSGDPRAGGS